MLIGPGGLIERNVQSGQSRVDVNTQPFFAFTDNMTLQQNHGQVFL